MSCTIDQARRFFASMCFASQNLGVFEKVLSEIPESDWPIIFLSSIIIENCGLKKIKNDLIQAARDAVDPLGIYWPKLTNNDEKGEPAQDHWVAVPNEYILRDRAWLFPVIRACDPHRVVFKEGDYGIKLIESLCDELSIMLRTRSIDTNDSCSSQQNIIEVNLTHAVDVIMLIISHPTYMGASPMEFEDILRSVLDDVGYEMLKKRSTALYKRLGEEGDYEVDKITMENFMDDNNEELSKGLLLLAVLIICFVATGLITGYYCKLKV